MIFGPGMVVAGHTVQISVLAWQTVVTVVITVGVPLPVGWFGGGLAAVVGAWTCPSGISEAMSLGSRLA